MTPATEPRTATVPGMVNAHSHAFQRDLRGAAERPAPTAHGHDDFWSWRTEMFRLAEALDPDSMLDVCRRAFTEMRAAGYVAVGEFHYVHHGADGTPYADPNAMAKAAARAAQEAGLAIVLLPAAYHRNGWDGTDRAPGAGQRRFCDPDVETFLARVDALRAWASDEEGVAVGVAAHSPRACPAPWLEAIATYADTHGLVRHVHACEQRRELDEVAAEHGGRTPIELLEDTGFLGPRSAIVHGIHATQGDIALLAASGTTVVTCPTTEGSLGDGYQPALRYRDAGVLLAVGSDSQVRIDPFEEVRELETGARREGQTRHALLAADPALWTTIAGAGAGALGQVGPLAPIAVDLDHPDLAGVAPGDLEIALVTCASAAVVRPG